MQQRITAAEYRALTAGGKRLQIPRSPPEERTGQDGVLHDSKTNLQVWAELGARQKVGEVVWAARDVRFWLKGVWYKADFVFQEADGGPLRFWEVKSKRAKMRPDWRRFRRNQAQVKEMHQIEVEDVER